MMDIYTFDEEISGEKVSGFAALDEGLKWSRIDGDDIGWINIIMQYQDVYTTNVSGYTNSNDSNHEIIKIQLPDMTDDEIMSENINCSDKYMGSVNFDLNAKLNKAIYAYNTDFDGIDESGNLVKGIEEKIIVHQISDFMNHPNAVESAEELDIHKLVASVSSYEGEMKLCDIVVVYDLDTGTAAFYREFRQFVNDLIGESIIYAGQLVIDEPTKNIKSDATEYIKMISVELFS